MIDNVLRTNGTNEMKAPVAGDWFTVIVMIIEQ